MNQSIQVRGTLPLVAEYFGAEEKRIFSIFNLNLKEETSSEKDKEVKNVKTKKTKK